MNRLDHRLFSTRHGALEAAGASGVSTGILVTGVAPILENAARCAASGLAAVLVGICELRLGISCSEAAVDELQSRIETACIRWVGRASVAAPLSPVAVYSFP